MKLKFRGKRNVRFSFGKLNSLSKFKRKNTKPIIFNKKRMVAYSRRLLSKRREIGNDKVLAVENGRRRPGSNRVIRPDLNLAGFFALPLILQLKLHDFRFLVAFNRRLLLIFLPRNLRFSRGFVQRR